MKKFIVFCLVFISSVVVGQTRPDILDIKRTPFYTPPIIGTGIVDETVALQAAVTYAATHKVPLRLAPSLKIKITGTVYISDGADLDFNGAEILNYSGSDAFSVATTSSVILNTISNVSIYYKNYGSSINSTLPPRSFDTTKAHGYQRVWNHITSGFTGAGFAFNASTGNGFSSILNSKIYYHKYGVKNAKWSVTYDGVETWGCDYGFYAAAVTISGENYAPNDYTYRRCWGQRNGYDIFHLYGTVVSVVGCTFEKGFNGCLFENVDALSFGSSYLEFSQNSQVTLANCRAVDISGNYFGCNAESFIFYANANGSLESFVATAGQTVFDVTDIANFASQAAADVLVVKNNQYVSPTSWTKSGSQIVFGTPLSGAERVDIVGNARYETSLNIDDERYQLGSFFGILVLSCSSVNVIGNHFYSPITVPIAVNDSVLNVRSTGILETGGSLVNSRTSDGVSVSDNIIRSSSASGLFRESVTFASSTLQLDQTKLFSLRTDVTSLTLNNGASSTYHLKGAAGSSVLNIIGSFGGVLITAPTGDPTASITASLASGMVAVGNTDPGTASKISIFHVSPGVIGITNRLGYALTFLIEEKYF